MSLAQFQELDATMRGELASVRARLAVVSASVREVPEIEQALAEARTPADPKSPYRVASPERIASLESRLELARQARAERSQLRVEEGRLLRRLEHARAGLERAGVRRELPMLDVTIATPCAAEWAEMQGDGDMRFCTQCNKHVFNLSMMSHEEAAGVIASMRDRGEGCVRLYRRDDGTMLTQDCQVGVRRYRFWRRTAGLAAAGLILMIGYAYTQLGCKVTRASTMGATTAF